MASINADRDRSRRPIAEAVLGAARLETVTILPGRHIAMFHALAGE
jgi:hypothetical protein